MPSVAPAVEELRVKDRSGAYRVFYYTRLADSILIFHAFAKKTQKTPPHQIALGQKSSDLNDKIIEVVKKKRLTHSEVAQLAHTSRTRVTAILNRNTQDTSTDLMLRVLASLGVKVKLQFKSAA